MCAGQTYPQGQAHRTCVRLACAGQRLHRSGLKGGQGEPGDHYLGACHSGTGRVCDKKRPHNSTKKKKSITRLCPKIEHAIQRPVLGALECLPVGHQCLPHECCAPQTKVPCLVGRHLDEQKPTQETWLRDISATIQHCRPGTSGTVSNLG